MPRNQIDFYTMPASPACRPVALLAKTMGLTFNTKLINLSNKDQMNPDFLKLNPLHCVPTIVDDGFVLWESRAILSYLVDTYAPDSPLFPKDPKKRATINARLDFDLGTLFPKIQIFYRFVMKGMETPEENVNQLKEAFEKLNTILTQKWVVGDQITIADFALVSSVSTAKFAGFDLSAYPNITRWLEQAKSTMAGYKEANEDPVKFMKEHLMK